MWATCSNSAMIAVWGFLTKHSIALQGTYNLIYTTLLTGIFNSIPWHKSDSPKAILSYNDSYHLTYHEKNHGHFLLYPSFTTHLS